jgi:hypothetical protein
MMRVELALTPLVAPPAAARSGPTVEATLDRSEASALADLQMHWDEAYAIGLDGDIWTARFRGCTDELRAHDSDALRELIRSDYLIRQRDGTARSQREASHAERGDRGDDEDDPVYIGPAGGDRGVHGAARYGYGDEDDEDDDDEDRGQHEHQYEQAGDAAASQLARMKFAGIRGERMST